MKRTSLQEGWLLRDLGAEWQVPARVPGTVVQTMLEQGLTEDPFWRENEFAAKELARRDYEYSLVFTPSPEDLGAEHAELVFEGLDTLAEVECNGTVLGRTDNMHRTWRFDVRGILRSGENELRVRLFSPLAYLEDAVAAETDIITYIADGAVQGNQYLRKAHCMFGWDWGPQIPDAGIWRPVILTTWDGARIEDIRVHQEHLPDGSVELSVQTALTGNSDGARVHCELTAPDGTPAGSRDAGADGCAVLTVRDPQLWWPNGYGSQPLYKLCVTLEQNGAAEQREMMLGLRTLTVSTAKDEWGSEFCFVVNGVKIFAMGADYIPEDSLICRMTPARTERLLNDAAQANFNCIRVWGGGFYPDDAFYDLCDRLGLIVWQDLLFACNVYAFTRDFENNICAETRDNVRRIRHHACLGLWCGNNELELGWVVWPRMMYHSPAYKADYIKQFEYVLPRLLEEEDPDTFYWKASPSSGGCFDDPNSENHGDVHYWGVWHQQEPFERYQDHYFRFCSEFGFQSFPCEKTVESFTLPQDRNIFSPVMENHQKNGEANGKILLYLASLYRYPESFGDLIYLSQLQQAEAIRCGVEHWRRNRGRCMGAVYWQLNDCWPVASWASIDYFGRWKLLHYAAKRFFAPQTVSIERKGHSVRFFALNESLKPLRGTLHAELRGRDFRVLWSRDYPVDCAATASQMAGEFDFDALCREYGEDRIYVRAVLEAPGIPAAEQCELFVPPKKFDFETPDYTIRVAKRGREFAVSVSAETFCLGLCLDLDGADAVFSDNGMSVATADGVTVTLDAEQLPEGTDAEALARMLRVRSVGDTYNTGRAKRGDVIEIV